ncbi:GcrA family cell cycle regulator [Bradyrhizobium sp. 150]|uniref:GcrA family cell cycle regulator n=1 Tax=Bradyrhizobium sp. 150 TaxID=2782625 RepID=UPI001FF6FE98|nr:GcrA family cell cycle regulator [Bradyrhizobium sp. 150]MCK1671060.1 hypothetical protein [Bradyrhizobium sp. 150]
MIVSWTEERVERLRLLHSQGLSCSQIAADLGGITRNAVIGKVHRLELPEPPHRVAQGPSQRRPRAPRCVAPSRLVVTNSKADAGPVPPIELPPIVLPPGADHPVTLFERGPNDCCAPLDQRRADGELLYCGDTRGNDWEGRRSPYCAVHHALFYVAPKLPQRRLPRLAGMPQ